MPPREPYVAHDAFLTEHRLCRPGLGDPDVTEKRVLLWCACGAAQVVRASGPAGVACDGVPGATVGDASE
jgi:hypothetical protein